MSLFNLFKRNNALDDFSCFITLEGLAARLNSLYHSVEFLDENTILIDGSVELKHIVGVPWLVIGARVLISNNIEASDAELQDFCCKMNQELIVKVKTSKLSERTLIFEHTVPNFTATNLKTINQVFILLKEELESGWREFEKRFPINEKKEDAQLDSM